MANMHTTQNIDFFLAQRYFADAEAQGLKLKQGHFETNIWLHNEKINLDTVLQAARNFPDAKTCIISDGNNKGFYIYSTSKKTCYKLVPKGAVYAHAKPA